MLEIGKANEVTFKVAVNGTSATPSVRLVIETPDAELGFSCAQGDGRWFTSVTLPEDLRAGDYPMRVEVVLNNRLFTPIKKTVTIARASEIAAPAETPVPEAKPVIKPVPEAKLVIKPVAKVTAPKIKEAPSLPPKKTQSLMKEAAKKAEPVQPPRKEPARVKVAEVVARPINLKPRTPVTLKRGEVVYE